MTVQQRQRITAMRGKGVGYGKIAANVGIAEGTIKSFCRRNNIPAGVIDAHEPFSAVCADNVNNADNINCAHCGVPLVHIAKAKKKRFCSDKCRLAWWNAHPDALNRKAVYQFICGTCGTAFKSYADQHRKYCSRACYGLSRRAR